MDITNLYLFIFIGSACISILLGILTEKTASQKGYSNGFLWGFLLGLVGVIVVEILPYNTNSNTEIIQKKHIYTKKDFAILYVISSFFMFLICIYMYNNEDLIIKPILLFIGTILNLIYLGISYIYNNKIKKYSFIFIIGLLIQIIAYLIINNRIFTYNSIAKIFILYNIVYSIILILTTTNILKKSRTFFFKAICSISAIFSVFTIIFLALDGYDFLYYDFDTFLYLPLLHILQLSYYPYIYNITNKNKSSKHEK